MSFEHAVANKHVGFDSLSGVTYADRMKSLPQDDAPCGLTGQDLTED